MLDVEIDKLINEDKKFVKTINDIGIDDNGDVDIAPLLSTFTTHEDLTSYTTIHQVVESITEKINEYDLTISSKIDNKINTDEITGVVNES